MNPSEYFASELRHARETAGMSQDDLASAINFVKSHISMVENLKRSPTREFAVAVDRALQTGGRFERMTDALLVPEVNPTWFRPWVHYEELATTIRWYEPRLVPGLLQVEGYALALLKADSATAARMERQAVLDTAAVSVIIDEAVLHRMIGSPAVMVEQLERLLTDVRAEVHVAPYDARTYAGVMGMFIVATVDGNEVGYVDTPARGFVVTEPEVVLVLRERWVGLAAEALPRSLSEAKIKEAIERWKAET